ncbi:MAG: PglZ domain-containing protein [Opitutaceae bacterium]|nr:PglZ domain-containing protein [Cytophagales bacterium]
MKYSILWADDEIDLLKPHILFLESKGYEVIPVLSGHDAIEKCKTNFFDVVFLDENMPGMSGLEALSAIKTQWPNLPVVMITKSEEEHIMEEAIGSKIADYLIKPINPNQVLSSLKKILDNKRLVSEKTTLSYQQDFRNLSLAYSDNLNHAEWADIYQKLVFWELEIDKSESKGMIEVFDNQKTEANSYFTRFIKENYEDWLNDPKSDKPLMSHQLIKKKVLPLLEPQIPVFFFLIDNLRLDQWKTIEPYVMELFNQEENTTYFSILPTTTAYARNAIFSGLLPAEIEKQYPQYWVGDDEEDGKNNHEGELLEAQLKRNKQDIKSSYTKILNQQAGKNFVEQLPNLMKNQLNAVVFNFVDMLSHARTDAAVIKELASDESAYRSITTSWFVHSAFYESLKWLAEKKVKVVITTDHGTIRVKRPVKIVGERDTNSNLRYKQGRNLAVEEKEVFMTRKPEKFFLPKKNVSTAFVFAYEDHFFAYPNNYNYFVNFYKDTFQHGGVSLEEIIIPFISAKSKKI